ncbi:MAG: tetratricopeptide repeat protein, partial [Clostridia bacterium]|nr:tetratricopeptide repeat protein [Clostridia bacterium]
MGLFGKNDKGQKPIEIQMKDVFANGDIIGGINNRIEKHITYQKPTVVLPQPPPPVDEYCGREADAFKVVELLDNSHAVLVHTWGGIGKTEFALKLAQDRFFGKAVFFDCSNSVDTALANCTSGTTDYNQQVACAVNELREKEDWLAVFDNIQSAGDAAKVLERFNSSGIMLLMTARQNFNTSGCGKYELPTVEDGAELFRRYHIDEENGERCAYSEEELSCVNEIVRLAGGHTLTLELLAKTCRASGRSVFDILKAMKEKGFSLEGIAAKVTRKNADEAHRFIEHLEKLYDIAGVVENHSELSPLMKKLCALDVSDTPSAELVRWCVIEDNDSLNELARLGWLREKALRYTMHNVVSEVLKQKIEPSYSDIEDTAEAINNELDSVWNDVERRYTPQPVQLQAKALLRSLKEDQPLLGDIANNAGLIERAQGRYAEALEYYKTDLAITEKVLGKEHPSTATTYNNIAVLYQAMGENEQALGYCKKALAIFEKVLGKEHPDTAGPYNNIAGLYQAMGEYTLA